LTTITTHAVPIGKPRDFFRTVPDPAYRRHAEVYVHKSENVIDEQTYLIGPDLWGQIEEAHPCLLVCVVDRLVNPRLLPHKSPKDGAKDNVAEAQRGRRQDCVDAVDPVSLWVSTGVGFKGFAGL